MYAYILIPRERGEDRKHLENLIALVSKESRPYLNENDLEDKMTKKCLKELKITIYINKVLIQFRWLNHRNFMIWLNVFNLESFCVWYPLIIFLMMHVSEDITC